MVRNAAYVVGAVFIVSLCVTVARAWPFGPISPTGATASGTSGKSARFTSSTGLGNGSLTDDGSGHVTVANSTGYGFSANPSGSDTDLRAFQASVTWTGTSGVAYAYHGLMTANTTAAAWALKVGCVNSGGGACRAIDSSDGDVLLNGQSGTTVIDGDTTFAPIRAHTDGTSANGTIFFGLGGTSTAHVHEKHSGTITPTSCGTSPSFVGGDLWGDLTVGSGSTTCTIPFLVAWKTAAPSCTVTPWDTANAVKITSISTTQIVLGTVVAGAKYTVRCGGH